MKPEGATKLVLHPVLAKEAKAFVRKHHRTHKVPTGGVFAIGVAREGCNEPCGVAIVGRPLARLLDDGWTLEVTRCCTDGTKNACSMLYGAAWRAARALGYRKLVTYTLVEEGGASLRGAGWRTVGECGGGTWNRKSRPRVDLHPEQKKIRWEREFETSEGE